MRHPKGPFFQTLWEGRIGDKMDSHYEELKKGVGGYLGGSVDLD